MINPPLQSTLDTTTKSGEGYLIITPDEFVEELAPFVEMKQGQGYIVTVALLSETGFTSSQIQTYIKTAYDTLTPRPAFLLLVGDTQTVSSTPLLPATMGAVTKRETDLYYATLDEATVNEPFYVPDVFVGRLPAKNESEVSIMVGKMIAYSNGGYQPWHSAASFIATCDDNYDHIATGSHNYVISSYTSNYGFLGDYPNSPMPGGDQLYCIVDSQYILDIEQHIISSLNDGRGIITYSGHGAPLAWSDLHISIFSSDIVELNNNDEFSFVASFSCETNDFGSTINPVGFGETWMLQASKGAMAFIGSAGPTQWGQDDVLERSFYDSIFENPLSPNSLREALNFGLAQVEKKYPGTALYQAQYYWETYNLLGDPSQQLWLIPRTMFYLPIIYK